MSIRLLKDLWLPIFQRTRETKRRINWEKKKLTRQEASMEADYAASEILLSISETILLPSSVMLELIGTLDKIDTIGQIKLPYPYVTIQFSHPIEEAKIMAHVEMNDLQKAHMIDTDHVMGLIIGNADQDFRPFPPNHVFNMMNCCVLFRSTSVNRVVWNGTDRPARPNWQVTEFREHEIPREALDNKMRMIKLCYAIGLFLNAPNVIVEKVKPDPRIQRKREKKGKQKLSEYHTVTIKKVQVVYQEPNKGSGSKHSRMYPVRGHFRRLKQYEEPIWIPNHYRGLIHGPESMRKEAYRVPPKKSPPDGIDSSTGNA